MNNLSPTSQKPFIKNNPETTEDLKSNHDNNLSENKVDVQNIITTSNAQETGNTKKEYVFKPTTFKEDVAIVFTVALLLSVGTYIAWRCDGCPPIQGQVKQLPPKSILDF